MTRIRLGSREGDAISRKLLLCVGDRATSLENRKPLIILSGRFEPPADAAGFIDAYVSRDKTPAFFWSKSTACSIRRHSIPGPPFWMPRRPAHICILFASVAVGSKDSGPHQEMKRHGRATLEEDSPCDTFVCVLWKSDSHPVSKHECFHKNSVGTQYSTSRQQATELGWAD